MKNKVTYRVYRQTLEKLLREKGTNITTLSLQIGHAHSYLSVRFTGGVESVMLERPTVAAIAMALDVEIKAVLAKPELNEKTCTTQLPVAGDDELKEIIRDGFKMLHADLRALLAEWKPKETEPKYQIKEREQP